MSTAPRYSRDRHGKRNKVKLGGKTKPKPNGSRQVPLATIRCLDLDRYFTDRYGAVLPDDDAGRDDAEIMLNHIAHRQTGDRKWSMEDWLDRRAPWLVGRERARLIRKVFKKPMLYKADTLARALGLTFARRQRLGITSIGSIDVGADQREELQQERNTMQHAKRRRAAGAVARAQYEANSISRAEPWKAEGISRTTWYRRLAERAEPQEMHYASDGLVSRIARVEITVSSS
ncbi:hypothetical protein [Bradyrhizobium sp. WSM471]|uniref:hypothetical protein n=1 Tax=Bradyrhizobium sp. WSM471 TaxID=319017 RepID=UPI00024D2DA4|nr:MULTISPECIES: hypothetical protein [Bradyrhizobium]EHR03235.1 hypothetical protein Bra471DRAFT_04004 [Bradyrhizobium sp. WSM471]UFW38462.1 hypothetical protein BcanWSM471_19645 [Bradyrhizobium canariense]